MKLYRYYTVNSLECMHVCLVVDESDTYLWHIAFYIVWLSESRVHNIMGRTSPSIVPVIKN